MLSNPQGPTKIRAPTALHPGRKAGGKAGGKGVGGKAAASKGASEAGPREPDPRVVDPRDLEEAVGLGDTKNLLLQPTMSPLDLLI